MKNLILQILICALLIGLSVSFAQAQGQNSKNLIEVNIYLVRDGEHREEDYSESNPFGLIAVKRMVDARSPLRGSLIALTGKLTEKEERQNLYSPVWGIKFVSVRLEKGTAYTYFTMPEGAMFSGDLSPLVFKNAVERTALQFSTVKKVVVCLDGILDFWSESEEPPRRCGK